MQVTEAMLRDRAQGLKFGADCVKRAAAYLGTLNTTSDSRLSGQLDNAVTLLGAIADALCRASAEQAQHVEDAARKGG